MPVRAWAETTPQRDQQMSDEPNDQGQPPKKLTGNAHRVARGLKPVQIWLTPEEMQQLEWAAHGHDMLKTRFARQAVLMAVKVGLEVLGWMLAREDAQRKTVDELHPGQDTP